MALGPPRRSARTSNSTAVTSENNDVVPAGTEEEIHLRGSSQLPPAIPNEEDRPLIEPTGKTHWVEVPTLGMDRTPASVLTCLLKDNHPGIVDYRGKSVAASCWVHYKAAKDTSGWSAADEVEAGLWLRFRYKPEDAEEVSKHVGRCCGELLSSIKYYARIQAILDHCRNIEKVNICDKVAGRRYLTREQYVAQKPKWCDEDAWRFFADKWSNPEWVQKSETNRANRYTPGYKPHRGGSNSIATVCQKLSKKEGREVSAIEAWVYTHRGSNTLDPNSLNTTEATVCLEIYKRKAIELNGESFDWLNSPVDVRALYDCSCGRPHGKWATFNGIINDREALRDIKRNRASRTAAKRQRQEEEQREKQRLIEDARRAKEYSQNMLEWGRSVHHYNTISHKFMEDMAAHTGMVWTAVPPPPPPPPPPTYGASSSPSCENNVDVPTGMARTAVPPPPPPHPPTYGASSSPSHENAPLNRSVNGENPDDTLARIAQGMFGGYVNASSSDARNHSPPVDDLGPF